MYLQTNETIQTSNHFAPVENVRAVETRLGTVTVEEIKNGPFTYYYVELGLFSAAANTVKEAVQQIERDLKNEILSRLEHFSRR